MSLPERANSVSLPGSERTSARDAVPLDLEGPALARRQRRRLARASAATKPGSGSAPGSRGSPMRWIIQSLPAVFALPGEREQRVAARDPLAVELDLHLPRFPLEDVVGPACRRRSSSRRRTGPSGCRRRTSGTRADGPRCGPRAGCRPARVREEARQRPRGERAVMLEPQVPVQPRRAVLLDDEAGLRRLARRRALGGLAPSAGFGRLASAFAALADLPAASPPCAAFAACAPVPRRADLPDFAAVAGRRSLCLPAFAGATPDGSGVASKSRFAPIALQLVRHASGYTRRRRRGAAVRQLDAARTRAHRRRGRAVSSRRRRRAGS